jgi:hypothetical protein
MAQFDGMIKGYQAAAPRSKVHLRVLRARVCEFILCSRASLARCSHRSYA